MRFQLPKRQDLATESDVEQKLIFPLLTAGRPDGFGFDQSSIQTKADIRKFTIGKGKEQKLYYPDYLLLLRGIPLLVVEAKAPGEGIDAGYREARLYAAELNAAYPSGINPLGKIFVSDGLQFAVGRWDRAVPEVTGILEELSSTSTKFAEVERLIDAHQLEADFKKIVALEKPSQYFKPRRMLGGEAVQHDSVAQNSFGGTVAAEFAHIFNPNTIEDRIKIATEGYVPSRRRERYIDPIDRVIRAAKPRFEAAATLVDDTSNPKLLIDQLKKLKPLEHQVLLIIGSPGAGKTTFIDHLQWSALPEDLIEATVWARLNMNNAPVTTQEIYDWIRFEVINGCRAAYPNTDFDEYANLAKVFNVEIARWKKGLGSLYIVNSEIYKQKLAEHLEGIVSDPHKQAVAYTRHCATERAKLLILVFDNCDKRNLEQQLVMFEAAQWIQQEFRALVILPLREETYDEHRHRPPLDTALNDLVFRIEPPLFHSVLTTRVQLALNELSTDTSKVNIYDLPNGMRVTYPNSEKAYYLNSLMKAIFEYDRQIRRIILGLSARNIRSALSIFLEFCRSGHIGEDTIFKIRQSEGTYLIPLSLVVRVLLRVNRRYYDSDFSYVKNLFSLSYRDDRPSYLNRFVVLRWLGVRFSRQGPSQTKGYFRIGDLVRDMSLSGADENAVLREVETLAKAQCVITEDFRTDQLGKEDLIRLGPAGFVHLELLENVDYLSAIAEDTWFPTEAGADAVSNRIRDPKSQYDVKEIIANAKDVYDLIESHRSVHISAISASSTDSSFAELTDLAQVKTAIATFERLRTAPRWRDVSERYPVGSKVQGTITALRDFGLFVELEAGVRGLVHSSRLDRQFQDGRYSPEDRIWVQVLKIDALNTKMDLAPSEIPNASAE